MAKERETIRRQPAGVPTLDGRSSSPRPGADQRRRGAARTPPSHRVEQASLRSAAHRAARPRRSSRVPAAQQEGRAEAYTFLMLITVETAVPIGFSPNSAGQVGELVHVSSSGGIAIVVGQGVGLGRANGLTPSYGCGRAEFGEKTLGSVGTNGSLLDHPRDDELQLVGRGTSGDGNVSGMERHVAPLDPFSRQGTHGGEVLC